MKKLVLLLSFFMLASALPVLAGEVPLISKENLKAELGAEGLVLLDVRSGRDWSSSEFKIKGAVRAAGDKIKEWSANYSKDTKLVLYCA